MARNFRVTDKDRGWKRVRKTLKRRSKDRYVDVGLMSKTDMRSDGPGNVDIGAFHEFGLGRVPERSFIRDTADRNFSQYQSLLKKAGELVIFKRVPKNAALALVGAKVQADMRGRIRDGIQPPLNPTTIARKGSSTPLIDTGQLVSSLTFEVGP